MRIPAFATPLAAALALGVLPGCAPSLIPGTNIEDTKENRAVLEFLGKYRKAVVERSAGSVVDLTTNDYFEDNGTLDQSDDYGREGLRERLDANFARTREVQLDILVQKIERPEGEDGPVHVAFRYNQRALVDLPAGQQWISVTDVNRIIMRPAGQDDFLIASGL